MVKRNPNVSSNRNKSRKAHFTAPSHVRRVLMSARLSKDLLAEHQVRSLPVRREDEVEVVSGSNKGQTGRITSVYRKKFVIHVAGIEKELSRGAVKVGIHPSNCIITKLGRVDKDRKNLIAAKAATRAARKSAD